MLFYLIYGFFAILISFFSGLLCFYYYKLLMAKYYLNKLPMVPQVPILGSILVFQSTRALYDNLMNFPKKYGRTYWVMTGPECVLFTIDARLMEIILSSSKHIDKPKIYKGLKNAIGNGLVSGNGDIWRVQRKLLTPTFHFQILEQFMKIFNKHTNQLVKKLDVQTMVAETDILQWAKQWSIGQVTETVMGLKPDGSDEDSTLYAESGKELLQISTERVIRPFEFIDLTYVFTSNYWKEQKLLKTVNKHIDAVIERKKKEYDVSISNQSKRIRDDGTKQKIASLDLLIEYQRNGAPVTDADLRSQAQTIMYAGFDTTATTVAFALYNFANNPEVQDRLFEEVFRILGDDINQEVTTGQLQEMKYMDMALKESLRVTSSIPIFGRELFEDIEWDGMVLPKGLQVITAICSMHMDPEYFPEPHKFIPERFTPENCKTRPAYAYVPFSAGPRNCIGQKYGLYAAKVCLAKLLLNYKFVSVGHKLVLASEVVLSAKTGVKVCVQRRNVNNN